MPIKNQNIDTYRVTGSVGSMTFSREVTGTLEDALAVARQYETERPSDGVFARGHASVRMWTAHGWDANDAHTFGGR